jgi:hypothetical protein
MTRSNLHLICGGQPSASSISGRSTPTSGGKRLQRSSRAGPVTDGRKSLHRPVESAAAPGHSRRAIIPLSMSKVASADMNRGPRERPSSAWPSFARDDGEAHGDRARLNVAIACREYAGETRPTRGALPTNQRIRRRFGIAGVVVNRDICAAQPVWMTLRAC